MFPQLLVHSPNVLYLPGPGVSFVLIHRLLFDDDPYPEPTHLNDDLFI